MTGTMNRKKTVLVISDMHEQFSATASMLRKDGYSVRFESHLGESLPLTGAEAPNLIISELAVPNVDGLQLCREVRNRRSITQMPILLVGDLSRQSSIVVDGFRCGASGYLQKPIDPLRLAKVCRSILSASSMDELFGQDGPPISALTANSSEIITIVRNDGAIIFRNSATDKMSGYTTDRIATSFFDLVHPADVDEVFEYFDSICGNGAEQAPVEHRFRQEDGSWKLVESTGKAINHTTVRSAIVVTTREVPEKLFTLAGTSKIEALTPSMHSDSELGVAIFSATGDLIDCNSTLKELLDYSEKELFSMPLSEFLFPSDLENGRRALEDIYSGRRTQYEFENGYLGPSGERIWGNVTIVSIPDDGSYFLLCIFDDPTRPRKISILSNDECTTVQNDRPIFDSIPWKIDMDLICDN